MALSLLPLTQAALAANPLPVLAASLIDSFPLWAYVLLGFFTWAVYGHMMKLGRKKMQLLKRPPEYMPANPPSVTIIIPAKDEGERIRGCLLSCIEQDYPNSHVLTIDDRSTDNTGAVMDEIAAAHPKLTVVHKTVPPPVGWTGKNAALWAGQENAKGDWLLFVDSDVVLEKDALSAAMAVVLRKNFDMISLLPRLESHTIWESMLVPLCGAAASTMYLVALTNNSQLNKTAFANGQFILISRKAYDAIGGHERVRDRFCEDIAIALQMKAIGLRPRVSWGTEFSAVRMYSSLGAIFRGWSRIYYAARAGSAWRPIAAVLFLLICSFSAYPAIVWGLWLVAHHGPLGNLWLAAGLAHWAMMTFCLSLMYNWSGNPRRNALYFPIAGPMLFVILLMALRMCITKRVEWRGTAYSHRMAPKLATGSGNASSSA